MDRKNAINLLNETFNNDFDNEKFLRFTKELFNDFLINRKDCTKFISKEYIEYVNSFEKIGDYRDISGKEIEVLTVKLNRTSSRDRARTMQRNFIASWLSKTEKEAALVAFYGDDPRDWRFSFVKMEYSLVKDEKGKTKIFKELTPAKRYSFLVGVNEPNHTCAQQFSELIIKEDKNPTIEEIERAFSIEKVTKEFFDKYKKLFLDLKESLDKVIKKDKTVQDEFEDKGIDSVDFTKKLLGQIVFLYFLQKKGWLGVEKGEDGKLKQWGTGPKDFMRKLFDGKIRPYKNFYNDVLEPLFYEALATERDDDYYTVFRCKIPFLNGGLFEPINDYNWRETDILLDNKIFEDIFKTFDEFNFTVKEDEPLEKEVAVDPEMLGKVFENLLEVKDRKSKGAFYTPREIVHYMCQQSLINYLETNTSISREDLEKFIQLGDLTLSNDQRIISEIQSCQEKLDKKIISPIMFENGIIELLKEFNLPRSIVDNRKLIDNLLKNIKIVDPAVGSGAFPVGMLNEIVKARSILTIFYDKTEQLSRNDYNLKREIIENCLYGVDIEPSAVEITKLRFWLSLIVDELDMKNIKPLPNLDHKIMCGNSLLEEFEGIKLFDEKLLGDIKKDNSFEVKQISDEIDELWKQKGQIITGKSKGNVKELEKNIKVLERKKQKLNPDFKPNERNQTLDEATENRIKESQKKLSEHRRLQKEFFNEQNKKKKKELKEDIDRIEWELIEETIKEQGNEKAIEKLEQYKKNKSKPFFLWKLYFSDVFQRENPGFDVVIANPPYVRMEQIVDLKESFQKNYQVFSARADIYTYFYERGFDILREKGVLTFISSNKFMRAKYGDKLRKYLKSNSKIDSIVDFGSVHMFEAITNTLVIVLRKGYFKDNVLHFSENINSHNLKPYSQDSLKKESWTLADEKIIDIMKKIESTGVPMSNWKIKISYGIKAGYNDAYIIDTNQKEELLKKNPKLSEIIKPLFRGRDIKRYSSKFADKWIIIVRYGGHDEIIKKYPEVFEHLNGFKEKLKNRGQVKNGQHHWLELDNNPAQSYLNLFSEKKIIWIELSDINKFAYSSNNEFILAGAFMITGERLKYLLGYLNSSLCLFYFKLICNSSGMNTIQWKKFALDKMPIKIPNADEEKQIEEKVNQILSITKDEGYLTNSDKQAKVKKLESEIDQLVYKLYELTPEEIKIVEEFNEE